MILRVVWIIYETNQIFKDFPGDILKSVMCNFHSAPAVSSVLSHNSDKRNVIWGIYLKCVTDTSFFFPRKMILIEIFIPSVTKRNI